MIEESSTSKLSLPVAGSRTSYQLSWCSPSCVKHNEIDRFFVFGFLLVCKMLRRQAGMITSVVLEILPYSGIRFRLILAVLWLVTCVRRLKLHTKFVRCDYVSLIIMLLDVSKGDIITSSGISLVTRFCPQTTLYLEGIQENQSWCQAVHLPGC